MGAFGGGSDKLKKGAQPSSRSAPGPGLSALSADTPISRSSEDLLGRAGFVRALANEVRKAPPESGFVIGLTGPWGSGKTSVLEMVGAELGETDVTAIVRFNPWLFSGTEQLVEHFFAELAGQLEASGSRALGTVAKALRGYGRVVSAFRYLPYVGEIARVSSEAAKDAGSALSGDKEATAHFRADELRDQLRTLDRPVVILLDDLDRLRKDEIVDVVRLVRLVGDFPNLVYLLAFDRPAVEAALGETRAGGRDYLEKIIHLCHDLPPIRPESLSQILTRAVEKVVPDPSIYRFEEDRHASLFWTEVRPMFETVRDVRRYENVLSATLDLIGDEVDFADVLALEALRLFEPEFFEAIVANRDLLTGRISSLESAFAALAARDDEFREKRLRELLSIPTGQVDAAGLLKRLFPETERYLGDPGAVGNSESEWRVARRVADPEAFDAYLYRRLPPGTLPARDVERTVRALADESQLNEIFDALDDEELRGLLDRLVHYEREFTPAAAVPAINAILKRVVPLSGGFREMSGALLVQRLLRGLEPKGVAAALEQVAFPSLSSRYEVVRMVGHSDTSGHRLVSARDDARLEREICDEVLASTAEKLADEVDIGPLVSLAERLQGDRLRSLRSKWIRDDRFFVRLLTSYRITSIVGFANRPSVQLLWPRAVEAFGETELGRRVPQIDPAWVEREFDDETAATWRQALRYLDDPKAGEREAAPYMSI